MPDRIHCLLVAVIAASASFASPPPDVGPNMADIVERVSPSVVNIVSEVRPRGPRNALELLFGAPARPDAPLRRGEGSGFLIDPKGLILTVHHVVDKADRLTVTFSNGRRYKARVKSADPTHDIAVLELVPPIVPPLTATQVATLGDSERARVGEWVLAIGSPFSLQKTVTKGIVSGQGRHFSIQGKQYLNLLQTDALINPGNSGGPLLDMKGAVIGINVAINPHGQGISFAIPINTAKRIATDLIAHGRYRPTWLGVHLAEPDEDKIGDPAPGSIAGVSIERVMPTSPASRAGLVKGDVLTQVNGTRVESPVELGSRIETLPAGEKATFGVFRNGVEQKLEITLGTVPETATANAADAEAADPR